LVTLILRMNGHRRVAQHGLGSSRCDSHTPISVLERITEEIEFAFLRFAQNLQVRKYGLIIRAPVNDAVATINQPVFVETHEMLAYGARKILIHRKAIARPIDRRPLATQLVQNLAAILLLPLPNALDELFATEIVPGQPFLLKLSRHHQLG